MCELISATAMTAAFGTAGAAAGEAGFVGALGLMDVLGGVGAIAGLGGMIQSSQASKAKSEYDAKVAANQAKVAGYQADDALARGEIAERQQRLKTNQLVGQQRASMGASGVSLDSGSFVDTLEDTAGYGELDALTIRSNAAKEAWGYRAQAAGQNAQAGLSSAEAGWSSAALPLQAGGSILTGFGTVADRWYRRSGTGY
jgi:hypothetical protein